jgi:ferrous iron transport protein A
MFVITNIVYLSWILSFTEDWVGMRINLRKMLNNQAGTIARIKVSGELGRRIRDMGLVPGTEIKIQGRAPLYDPVALRVRGATLTLRNNEADFIEVEVE